MANREKYVQIEADTAIAAAVSLWFVRAHMEQKIRESESEVLGDWFAEDINVVSTVKELLMHVVEDAGFDLDDIIRVIAEVREWGADHE